jgi:HlyD family secretion protein
VIPERKPTDPRIVRPAGFAPNLSPMDVPRTGVAAKKRKRRIMIIAASVLGLILATIAISRLKPAVPSVDRSTVWVDTVKRGPMVRQVRGLGTLIPEDIRWIATNTEGRVEKINIWPGTHVEQDSVILEMSSPEVEQAAHDAQSKATAAESELTTLRATLQRELLDQEATTAKVKSDGEERVSSSSSIQDIEGKRSRVGKSEGDRRETTELCP